MNSMKGGRHSILGGDGWNRHVAGGGGKGILGGDGAYISGERNKPFRGASRPAHREAVRNTQGDNAGLFRYSCHTSQGGKVLRKEETGPLGRNLFEYSYDDRGHLTGVRKNGSVAESYRYDDQGRRVEDYNAATGESRYFHYGRDGELIRMQDNFYSWTRRGQLESATERGQRSEYEYGHDTRLDCALLSTGEVIRYEYGNELLPVLIKENTMPVAELEWEDFLWLSRYLDIKAGLTYSFHYGKGRVPGRVKVEGDAQAMLKSTGIYTRSLDLQVYADQVDSIRVLSTCDGKVLKCLDYDSFGNVIADTRPHWRFPLGFACGLSDHYTGFVRFGFRDYDPRVGRFTAKDPIGYTGGDYDLWDYCVDDPVSMNDPSGLIPPLVIGALGFLLSGVLGGGGAYVAAKAADKTANAFGHEGTKAQDGLKEVAPYAGGVYGVGSLPITGPALVKLGIAAGKFGLTGLKVATEVTQSLSRYGAAKLQTHLSDKGLRALERIIRFSDGLLIPLSPMAPSGAGALGAAVKAGWEVLEELRNEENLKK